MKRIIQSLLLVGILTSFCGSKVIAEISAEQVAKIRKDAEKGDANAQYNLGACYGFGRGVPRDDVEAVKWYRKAAEQGDANAQSNLGVCYAVGKGVPKNVAEAVKWYRKAAGQGEAKAQCSLGFSYASGKGVIKDNVMAYMWFNLSAAGGEEFATENREILAKSMTPEQIAEAQKLSREWKPKKEGE